MATRITKDVLESYLNCKYKSHLKLAGEQGIKCDYETLLAEKRDDVRLAAIDRILAGHLGDEIPRHSTLTTLVLKRGVSVLLDASLENDFLSLIFDGLKKVDGKSDLGDFHYIPILFHEGEKIGNKQRLLLEVYGSALQTIQGKPPQYGIVWHGRGCNAAKVRLRQDSRMAEQILSEMKEMQGSAAKQALVLNSHCQMCEFRQRCHAQAVEEDNLSLLLGMEEKQMRAYNKKGFFTITQISHTFRYRKPRKRAKVHAFPHYYSLQALSVRTGIVHIHGAPSLPKAETIVYIDIEGVPERDFYYLIGALVESARSCSYHSFWADDEKDQDGLFLHLADFIQSLPGDCPIVHYGNYEPAAIKRVVARVAPDGQQALQAIIGKMVNVLSIIHHHIYFPTFSNTLKEIGKAVGYQWSNSQASGIQSIVWREQWERTHDPKIKAELLAYNEDDCAALKKVCGFIADAATPMREPRVEDAGKLGTMLTSDLPKPPSKWPVYGRPTFVLDDLQRASECAYFDYQRERVYVRTNRRFKRINRRTKPRRGTSTPNKRILLECKSCPACSGTTLRRKHRLKRKTIDLRFFKGGIRKWVVLYRSWSYQCESCGHVFTSPDWPSDRSLFQPGLMCWCVYQNIECRQTMWQVGDSLADVFGLHVQYRRLYQFKTFIAKRYEALQKEICESILKGHLIHADEATVDLKNNEKGYVWVFTSLDRVYYFYKSSREGTFLNAMLTGFQGVLVSDFFSAYQSLNCLQQKCLLHFLRDVNEDLQKNPFNEEFKLFAQQFAALLRGIVDTIDKNGLSKFALARHVSCAKQFLEDVGNRLYLTDVMIGYQKRIKKNSTKLFTFLEYDNVPWNNNNAEHAIKYLAKYKRVAEGMFSERSLKESLVLLSVFQTCHFSGVSALRFLLSGKADLASILANGEGNGSGAIS